MTVGRRTPASHCPSAGRYLRAAQRPSAERCPEKDRCPAAERHPSAHLYPSAARGGRPARTVRWADQKKEGHQTTAVRKAAHANREDQPDRHPAAVPHAGSRASSRSGAPRAPRHRGHRGHHDAPTEEPAALADRADRCSRAAGCRASRGAPAPARLRPDSGSSRNQRLRPARTPAPARVPADRAASPHVPGPLVAAHSDGPGRPQRHQANPRRLRRRAAAVLADPAAIPLSCGVLLLRQMRRLFPMWGHYIMRHSRP